jgi:transcriptional regulator with XRE-family HTH domain
VLGEEIRKARLAAGLTQEELGFRAGVTRNYVSMMELETNSPTVSTLFRVCEALGVKASVMLAAVESKRARKQDRRRDR